MTNILVLYASSHGTTEQIAAFIAARLRSQGHHVDLADASAGAPALAGYGGVVIGSRVHFARHARSIRRFVERHRQELDGLQAAVFSVSLSAVNGGRDIALDRLLRETRWRPALSVSLAGDLPYTRYNWLLRLVMKRISRKAGHTTDTTRDHTFVDWTAVTRFADAFARRLSEPMPVYPWRPAGTPPEPVTSPR